MNHADPETMRARARQAVDFLKQQLVRTGTIEPLVAFYFSDHIEQIQFEDPSILEHFDVRTVRSFDYLRTLAKINKPQAALITLDVRMGALESEDKEVVADTTAIFVMFDSPVLTIQAIAPYTHSNGRITVSKAHFSEMPGDENASPCQMLKIFSGAAVGVC